MAFNPGRNVGRLSVRVVPDTTQFRRELTKQLDNKLRTFSVEVKVNRAKVDGAAIKNDIRRQMQAVKASVIDVAAKVKVDDSELKNVAKITPALDQMTVSRLRRDVQRSLSDIETRLTPSMEDQKIRRQIGVLSKAFDSVSHRLAHDILSPADAEKLRHRLNEIKDQVEEVARDRTARVDVNPFTAWASARLEWLTRPRVVEIVAQVQKQSLVNVATALAALSGARLGATWVDDLVNMAKELDKNLPKVLGGITGIGTLIGAIGGLGSGLAGIGGGLFSILPALLVLPGLALNALGSATALIVALRDSGTQLASLKDDVSELGDIIREAFWDRARQPILDLVNGLMPQLRNSFRDLSAGVGDFTGAMAKSFGTALAGGRLESIFKGIADGWRILATGSDGFAGAMVSLSQIAATYTPRLAQWLVRQANTFDKWLTAISTDGRLGDWMEDAIDSIYDVWDATKGLAGVFSGIWKAADAAGSGGLKGFAQMMLDWEKSVNSPAFQKGLVAFFRGSNTAMSGLADGFRGIGDLIGSLDKEFESLIGASGQFVGGLVRDISKALDSPEVARGMLDLSEGLLSGLDKIQPYLQPIADTFGGFLGLLGDLANTALPAAASVLEALMPSIDAIIGAVRNVLPDLSITVTSIADTLGPAISGFVDKAAPLLGEVLVDVASILEGLAPILVELLDKVGGIIGWLGTQSDANQTFFEDVTLSLTPDKAKWRVQLQNLLDEQLRDANGRAILLPVDFDFEGGETKARAAAEAIAAQYDETLREKGKIAADALIQGLSGIEVPPTFREALEAAMGDALVWDTAGANSGAKFSDGLVRSFRDLGPVINVEGTNLGGSALGGFLQGVNSRRGALDGAGLGLGSALADGVASGIWNAKWKVTDALVGISRGALAGARLAMDVNSPSRVTAKLLGEPIADGVVVGVDSRRRAFEGSMRSLVAVPATLAPSAPAAAGSKASSADEAGFHKYEFNVNGVKNDPVETGQVAAHTFANIIRSRGR